MRQGCLSRSFSIHCNRLPNKRFKKHPDLTVAGLIHDLNNVFQTIIGLTDGLSEAQSRAILRNVHQGIRVSRSLETAASPGASFETILNHAIAFVEDVQTATSGPAIRFQRKIAPGVDLRRDWAWERVLLNLFLNAVRAMPQGGTIEVEARRTGANYLIEIRDTGNGISPKLLVRLFRPDVTTKAHGGLGLHVVKSIIHEDGGSIEVRNRTDGPGAEFRITVPVAVAGLTQTAVANGTRH